MAPPQQKSMMNGIEKFTLQSCDLSFLGRGLSRPECILAELDGNLWVSDDKSAILHIAPNGAQRRIGAIGGKPNGIAMARDGSFYIANIEDGRLYSMDRDGHSEVLLDAIDGKALGALNFVMVDAQGRLWMSVSTRLAPRSLAIESVVPDGYVIQFDKNGPRVVSEGYAFTNEVRLDKQERFLYVAETTRGRIVRHELFGDGGMGPVQVFGPDPLFPGAKVDGITFDADGNLWVTEITRNALAVITPQGRAHVIFEDPDAKMLDTPTSVTFCGPDLRTVLVGSLKMDRLATFRSPVAGLPLAHWNRSTSKS